MYKLVICIIKKLSNLIIVLIGVSILTFSLSLIMPGDPAETVLKQCGLEPTKYEIQDMREKMGLNDKIIVQYGRWIKNVASGNLGVSFKTGESVSEEILARIPATIELTFEGFFIMLLISFPLGILSALYENKWIDHVSRAFSFIGVSMPSFWMGLLFIYFFAVKLGLFPVMGRGTLKHAILPALTLGIGMAAKYTRLIRASMLEVLEQDFILTARSRGLKEKVIIINNALKNAMIPIITVFGISFGNMLGGSVIVEQIFAWPGIGKFLMEAIMHRDYPVIQAYVLWMAAIFVFVNFIIDLSYRVLDPRIR